MTEVQPEEGNTHSPLFSPAFQKAVSYNMVTPEKVEKGRSAFPPLWKAVLCTLDTHMEADIIWDCSLCPAEDN